LGWYRGLSNADRAALDARFWREGRMKLEPWLAPRLADPSITSWPNTHVAACGEGSAGAVEIRFADGRGVEVDHVIFATGYRVDMARIPFLSAAVRAALRTEDGFPALDTHMQTSVPGLYVTSLRPHAPSGSFSASRVPYVPRQ
jgi:thioredoxin reductase